MGVAEAAPCEGAANQGPAHQRPGISPLLQPRPHRLPPAAAEPAAALPHHLGQGQSSADALLAMVSGSEDWHRKTFMSSASACLLCIDTVFCGKLLADVSALMFLSVGTVSSSATAKVLHLSVGAVSSSADNTSPAQTVAVMCVDLAIPSV